jgi:hypothetical protein
MIKVDVTTPDLTRSVDKMMPTAQDLVDIADAAGFRIRKRTQGGKDVNEAEFKPYSDGYLKFKTEEGRDTSKVDLTFENHMLGSITTRRIQDGAELFFSDSERRRIAKFHHFGEGQQPERRFFALNGDDVKYLLNMLQARINSRAS